MFSEGFKATSATGRMKVAADKRSGHGMFNSQWQSKGRASKFHRGPNNVDNGREEERERPEK